MYSNLVIPPEIAELQKIAKQEIAMSKKIGKAYNFTRSEDALLIVLRKYNPFSKWRDIATFVEGRTPRQCRERYNTYLSPSVNKAEWTKEDDERLLDLVQKNGKKWSSFQKFFPGRSSNCIKNRFNVSIKKRLLKNAMSEPNDQSSSSSEITAVNACVDKVFEPLNEEAFSFDIDAVTTGQFFF